MRNYEITFIVDPVLSGEEIKATAQTYVDNLRNAGCEIVHVDEMGLRTMAYAINKRNSGIYYSVEVSCENGDFLNDYELAMRRDERLMRFLTVKLDKYGVQYNADKRDGKIGKTRRLHKQEKAAKQEPRAHEVSRKKADAPKVVAPKPAPKAKEEEE